MILKRILNRSVPQARPLYGAIVAAARHPSHYADLGVADTVDGRFEMVCLYLYLVLARLKGENREEFRGELTDEFFADMDRALREMGVGDLSVGKKVRRMAESFYGRVSAYEAAGEDEAALAPALARNVYAESDARHAPALAARARSVARKLASLPVEEVLAGKVDLT
ncbi:MAG: ubiquinol-cytochrome C chaperone [Rhizobiales bacterium]|nr:ubiquinol-cytochrome C chaperone [Hyphomicrobiales bacterium]